MVLNATTSELMTNPHTRQLVEQLMREVVADGRACGVDITDDIVGKMLAYTDKMTPYRTSMKTSTHDERHP